MQRDSKTEISFSDYEPVQKIGGSMRIEDYIIPENVIPIIRNKQVLEDLPKDNIFVSKEELVVLFCIEIPMQIERGVGLIQVTDKIIDLWGMDTQEVYETALKNMQERNYIKIYTMDSVINSLLFGTEKEEISKEVLEKMQNPFLAMTSVNYMNGSAGILDTDKLQEISEAIGQDLYILPSSIHECLLLPKSEKTVQELKEMVQEVNRHEVEPEEWLSDNVYEYSAATKEITIAGNGVRKRDSVEYIRSM